jgi:hypothetical protein
MLQTWQTCRQAQQEDGRQKLTDASAAFIMATQTQGSIPVREQVKALQSLDRQEVLQLFLWDCEAPANLAELDGDWNGELLENNGVVLTQVTNFLTNGLFGKGRKWNGKLFDGHDGRGRNRFFSSSKTTNEQIHPVSSESTTIDTEHTFDLSVAPSRLGVSIKEELQDNDNSNTDSNSNQATPHEMMKVALCDYTQHQSRFSLWYSMKDELRVVKCSNGQIVLGLGSMGWSGSIWNASPFCLWRETSDPASSTDADEAVSS